MAETNRRLKTTSGQMVPGGQTVVREDSEGVGATAEVASHGSSNSLELEILRKKGCVSPIELEYKAS